MRMKNWRQSPLILNLGTGWNEWSASRPCRFHPGAQPRYAWLLVKAGQDAMESPHDVSHPRCVL